MVVRTRADAEPQRWRLGRRWLYKRTRAVIAANSKVLTAMEKAVKLPPVRAIIHQGLEPYGDFQPAPTPTGFKIGLLGRLDPVKGHGDFIAAAGKVLKEFPQVEFLVAES